jgi:hypothetical protein
MLVGDPSSGYSFKCTVTDIANIIETDIGDAYVTLTTTQTISGVKTFSNNLTLTSVTNASVDTDKFLVLSALNVVTFRTGSEVLSDIGAQGTITLTTTGTSGAATFSSNTLNIPQYQGALTLTTTGTSGAATLVGNTLNIPNYAPDLSGYVPTSRTITINGVSQDLSANRTYNVGTVTSVAATAGTGISISGSPITSSGTLTITNTAPDQVVALTAGTGISISGTYPNFTITNISPSLGGTVTSVALSAPTGFSVTGSPVTTSGTLGLTFATGYSLPTTASQVNWDAAYNDKINSVSVSGTTTKTLTLTQQDGGTLSTSWTDDNTDAVTSVFGRTGAVVATEGDYSLTQLSDVTITTPTNGQVLKYNGTTWINDTDANTGTVTSVALSVPTGLSVSGSPITSSGTLAVTFASGYSISTTASQTNWDTAYTNRITSLTTTGSSGAATLISNTLNIPNYTLSGLGGVPTTRTLTINGTALDLSVDRSWSVGTVTSVAATAGTGISISGSPITSSGTLTITNTAPDQVVALTAGTGISTSGTYPNFTITNSAPDQTVSLTAGSNITITGTYPNFTIAASGGGGMAIGGSITSATAGSVLFAGASGILAQDNANFFWDNTNSRLGIGTTTPILKLDVIGGSTDTTTVGGTTVEQISLFRPSNGTGGIRTGFNTANGDAYIWSANSGSNLYFGTRSAPNNNINLAILSTGNIGIGTTTVGSNLQINGNAAIGYSSSTAAPTNGLAVAGASTFANNITLSASSTNALILQNSSSGESPNVTFITPVNKYNIDANATGNLRFFRENTDGTGGAVRMNLTDGGSLGIGTTTIGSTIQVNGNAAIGYSASTAAPTNGLAVAGNIDITGTSLLKITGNATNPNAADALYLWNEAGFGPNITGLKFAVNTGSTGATSKRFIIETNGNVGINTATIGSRLQVNGNAAIGYSASTAAPTNGLAVSGNVGIGTTSPFSLLQVTSGTSMTTTGGDQASNATIEGANVAIGANFTSQLAVLSNSSIAADIGGGIAFGSKYSGNAFAYYAAIKTGKDDATSGNYGGYLQFATRANGGNVTERMRITSGGNVGIGTTSPAYKLDVVISSGPYNTRFHNSSTSTSDYNAILVSQGASGSATGYFGTGGSAAGNTSFANTFVIGTQSNSAFVFNTNDTERMRITSGGLVGIGTTSTSSKLEVYGTSQSSPSTVDAIFKINSNATNALVMGTLSGSPFATYIQSGGSNTYPLALNPNGGSVGIGTTTIGSTLQVNGNAAIGYSASTAGPTNGLSISGNTTIGTTSASGKFTIDPDDNQVGLAITGTSLTSANAQSLIDLAQTWNTTGNPTAIKLNITNTASGATADLMELQVGGTSQFTVDKSGNTIMTGSVKTGAPTGGTAATWKLGSKISNTMAFDDSGYLEVEVGGTTYYVALCFPA